MLKEKGDGNLTASMGISGSGLYNVQGAYAVSKHVGVMANGMYHQRRTTQGESKEDLNVIFGEAGAGYFHTFGEGNGGVFQYFGGAGYGNSNDKLVQSGEPGKVLQGQFANVFVQPGIAYVGENFNIGFDIRANYVNVFHIRAPMYTDFAFWNTQTQQHVDTSLSFANLEPAITMRLGGEQMKFHLQLGAVVPFYKPDAYLAVNNAAMLAFPLLKVSFGLNYRFSLRKNKEEISVVE